MGARRAEMGKFPDEPGGSANLPFFLAAPLGCDWQTRESTVTQTIGSDIADRELKAKHRAMWALGDYPAVATDIIPELGPVVVAATGIGFGDDVLDVAAGSGNAAVPAALAGARVVASDLTPELFPAGREYAARSGVSVAWEEGDAEALPYAGNTFDAVISTVGVMFAPHHQAAADELIRVCRPGGRIGLIAWTPGGFIGEMFRTMKPYAAPAPAGALPPPLWGDEDHVRSLLGDRVTDVAVEKRVVTVDGFATPPDWWTWWKTVYGPIIAAYRRIADNPDDVAALDRDLHDLTVRYDRGTPGSLVVDMEYLLFTARKR